MQKLIFYPPAVNHGEWYRLFTYGLLHADWTHLIFNMFTLYLFGQAIEVAFQNVFGRGVGILLYLVLYILALLISILPTYNKEKENGYYYSLGASGAISAVVFAYILVYPMSYMGIIFIPVMLPAFIFGIIFVILSIYLDKQQHGNINHLAHITGGIFGMIFMFIVFKWFAHINIFEYFVNSIQITSLKDLIHLGY